MACFPAGLVCLPIVACSRVLVFSPVGYWESVFIAVGVMAV